MNRSESRRRGALPVLKSGGRWPCITVHDPPSLQPAHRFEGDGAAAALADHLAALAAEAADDTEAPTAANGDRGSTGDVEKAPSRRAAAAPAGDAASSGSAAVPAHARSTGTATGMCHYIPSLLLGMHVGRSAQNAVLAKGTAAWACILCQ